MTIVIMLALSILTVLALNKYSEKKGFGYSKTQQFIAIITNMAIWMGFLAKYGYSTKTLLLCLASSILVSIFFVDLKHYIIPNEYNLALFALAIFFVANTSQYWTVFVKGGFFFALTFLVIFFVTKGSIGMGDVKMSLAIGLMMGIGYLMNYLIVTFLLGALVSVILLILKKNTIKGKIAFGPYMVIAFFDLTLGIHEKILSIPFG
ncbi:prepilin peptidase [Brevibacillus sp. NPDC058079]|uniref:prepilin peptidase n=1 Tax=Brevibacillus sp. NPDC058079 TaxID=3346330 RepID=UPI0036ED9FB6